MTAGLCSEEASYQTKLPKFKLKSRIVFTHKKNRHFTHRSHESRLNTNPTIDKLNDVSIINFCFLIGAK